MVLLGRGEGGECVVQGVLQVPAQVTHPGVVVGVSDVVLMLLLMFLTFC